MPIETIMRLNIRAVDQRTIVAFTTHSLSPEKLTEMLRLASEKLPGSNVRAAQSGLIAGEPIVLGKVLFSEAQNTDAMKHAMKTLIDVFSTQGLGVYDPAEFG